MTSPKPKLKDDTLYFAHDRVTCGKLRCAGMSAHFTGYTIGGAKCRKASARDAEAFRAAGLPLACEGCGLVYKA